MAEGRLRTPLIFLTVLVIAACGLVYELVAGALASYVLGDSVTQFSIVIGAYLSALGLGAWLSRYVGDLGNAVPLRVRCGAVLALLAAALVSAQQLTSLAEDGMYADEIIYAKQSAYQRIVMTRGRAGFQLFLDGNLQFASADEYRYHEALVHPAFAAAARHGEVLVLGGGDGLAVREILRHADVRHVTLVDLDPAMTELA